MTTHPEPRIEHPTPAAAEGTLITVTPMDAIGTSEAAPPAS